MMRKEKKNQSQGMSQMIQKKHTKTLKHYYKQVSSRKLKESMSMLRRNIKEKAIGPTSRDEQYNA